LRRVRFALAGAAERRTLPPWLPKAQHMKLLGIVADDLTGAGDIGGLLARRGYLVRVHALDTPLSAQRTDIAIIDTDSRFDAPEIAAEKVRRATRALQQWGAERFYKKTCSVFRGNVAAEFDAMLDELGEEFAPVLAAYPQNGRTTKNGIHFVHGVRLEHSQFAHDPVHPRTSSDLVAELRAASSRPVNGDGRRGYRLCDAATQADVAALARTYQDSRVFMGSAALAAELAYLWPAPQPNDALEDLHLPSGRGVLVVAGSVQPQTRAQLQALKAVEFVLTLDNAHTLHAPLKSALHDGSIVVLRSENSPDAVQSTREQAALRGLSALDTSKQISENLAHLAAEAVRATHTARVLVLGGDTSAAVCRALDITHTRVYKEIEPGVPSTLTPNLVLVLKSGSFGSPGFLTRAIRHVEKIGHRVRARELIRDMTVPEKVAELQHNAPGVERLGLPKHNYWNECLHGVARAGQATVFPQAIGLAATWNVDLLHSVAQAIQLEARAKHHDFASQGSRAIYQGLTYWSPNINLCRDPRWGRAQETYGEDPYLTARLGVGFIRGLQGDDPRKLQLVATPKHFAVHSGPEALRHSFDARPSEHDLWTSYLPHFQAAVTEGGAESIMTAYSRLNGEPCSSSSFLLQDILRERWGFDGFVVSDCDAINDIHGGHGTEATPAAAAARALKAGCDLECGCTFKHLEEALQQGLIHDADLDRALERVLTARLQLDTENFPPLEVVDSPPHRQLALQAARESMVLLQNDGTLPLAPEARILVVGPVADRLDVLLANYNGVSSKHVTLSEGFPDAAHVQGCPVVGSATFDVAVEAALGADVVVACLGLTPELEGEEMDAGDRDTLGLPGEQEALLQALRGTGKPVVLVLTGGAALAGNWSAVNAIVMAWYPGEEGGTALADVLYGRHNPCGKLPVTFFRSVEQLPALDNYSMEGRTHRYFQGEPLWWFGHGLSYTSFATAYETSDSEVQVTIQNTGSRAGAEVAQLYCDNALVGFHKLWLEPGESKSVRFTRPDGELRVGPR
jgi:beta-glucosidase